MNLNVFKGGMLVVALSCITSYACAEANKKSGGISLGSTRVIYPLSAKQVSLSVINHSDKERYLINSWVETKTEEKTNDFILTPPLFVAEPLAENTLRIVNLAKNLPQDRESVFWLNVKSIPAVDKELLAEKNILQLAVLSRIKLFVRPEKLKIAPEEALTKVKFIKTAEGVEVDNQSPYHISFVNLELNTNKLNSVMAAPFQKTRISKIVGTKLTYQTVNDYGGVTEKVEVNLN
ncbi:MULTISPECIES: fimbria/pilus periplasmic chaperone [Acinetobacter]|uniref:fimbria/pilus periplasmic chaperone n=1 Tax=Acinetobacter TaxID=469 RepID=UPI0002AEADB4|nr:MULTISPECIES: fimbria/pilus periplasmic chaperone [Acinetobacter]ELW86556.1 gram-negative pili assembly chaperone, N-terminal domain protein [Acinetobacter sp. WC-743]MBJ8427991.1 fimbria/pilus periplasmic chaperone [Acinetobacter bereziniae]MBJ8474979.1 fimbria/pilus periplasmic chaperone [Acinetobacter bereziniae]MBJ9370713.1 fimbria/pilus periplasmic chaperone [Acinetobacter sp. TGL-Y2]MBO3652835.1 fimbria/pilus periplasmic chaperone [Acinetobacter bereziniae]